MAILINVQTYDAFTIVHIDKAVAVIVDRIIAVLSCPWMDFCLHIIAVIAFRASCTYLMIPIIVSIDAGVAYSTQASKLALLLPA